MKRFTSLAMTVLLCISLCGCTSWMEGAHTSVKPHKTNTVQPDKNVIEVFNYQDLQNALLNLVHSGDETAVLSVSQINQQSIDYYMEAAIRYVTDTDAIGAYAVDEITYEQGTTAGKPALAIKIAYRRDRLQVIRMQSVETMEDFNQIITESLENLDSECVVLVKNYQQTNCIKLVRDAFRENPQSIMESPSVVSYIYPESGSERVVELQFTYENSETDLRTMQSMVEPVFAAAELYVSGSRSDWSKFAQLYAFLMERNDYKIESSITPSYHLLHYGVGDSDAFATVYSAMCRGAGLSCENITGTKDGEPWSWNQITIEGTVYYLDLLECEKNGGFFVKGLSDMSRYEWEKETKS